MTETPSSELQATTPNLAALAGLPWKASGLTATRFLLLCLAAAAVGGILGHFLLQAADSFGVTDPADVVRRSNYTLLILGASVLMTFHFTLERICHDHETAWPIILFARGVSRRAYVGLAFASALAVGLAFNLAGSVGFIAATGQWNLMTDFVGSFVLPRSLVIWSFGSLALVVSVLARQANRGQTALFLVIVGPYLAYSLMSLSFMPEPLPPSIRLALLSHLPPMSVAPSAALHHAAYAVGATGVAMFLTPRLFCRYD